MPSDTAPRILYPIPEKHGLYGWRPLGIEFVRVPGGEVPCVDCHDGWIVSHDTNGCSREACDCALHGTPGVRRLAPFYLGRYPVTWGQWREVPGKRSPPWPEWWTRHLDRWRATLNPDARVIGLRDHPVVNVSAQEAGDYATWAGLRLPTDDEWRWAALGAFCDGCRGALHLHRAGRCPEKVPKRPRRFPWGDMTLPGPERCVAHPWATGTKSVTRAVCPVHREPIESDPDAEGQRDLHVCKEATGRGVPAPARPFGASWCGAQDMAGNVWEWTLKPGDPIYPLGYAALCRGGSWRTSARDIDACCADAGLLAGSTGEPEPRDTIGFRVALSGVA